MCKLWMIISSIVNLAMMVEAAINEVMFKIGRIIAVFAVLYIVYKLYCLYVVYCFIKEIQSYGAFNNCLKGLSDKEVEEFEKGHPPEVHEVNDQLELVKKQAFNQDFEIAMSKLKIGNNITSNLRISQLAVMHIKIRMSFCNCRRRCSSRVRGIWNSLQGKVLRR